MITEIFALITTDKHDQERVLFSDTDKAAVERRKQELEWSFIQNTGQSRDDLSIALFMRA